MSETAGGVSLNWLLDGIAALPTCAVRVTDLTLDSRAVRAGGLFLALPGTARHGIEFTADAAMRGAAAVLWDPEGASDAAPGGANAPRADGAVFCAAVVGLKRLVGRIADRFFGRPSSQMRVIGITGTNGKTTCAFLLAQCLERLGRDAAYIGTVGWGRLAALQPPTHTTPDVVSVHRELAGLRAQGVHDVAIEVSSHALDQGRVDGVQFHSAAFTNLTRDHLDYHSTMEAYGAAKARLFEFPDLKDIVINVGDGFGRELAARCGGKPVTAVWVGSAMPASGAARVLFAAGVALDLGGIELELDGSFGGRRLTTRLIGRFNAENAVIVTALLVGLGFSLDAAAGALAAGTAPPGRMELLDSGRRDKPRAVIDYAHTPDALAKALAAVREHCRGALWCVFGCGGDRDPGKRPLMGAVVDELADRIIVTDDNPRSESPRRITDAILRGIKTHDARVIHDRALAIATALTEAAANDFVVIAGKGHEDYQIYGDQRRDFSDRAEARRHLGEAA